MRILTWNIHKCIGGTDRRYDPERTVSILRHYDADILLLQEVAIGIPSLRRDDQARVLQDALGFHAAFFPEHQFKTGGYGNLILSRYPLEDVRHLDLTVSWRKRRGVLQAHIRVPIESRTRTVVVHNLHLGLAGSERDAQMKRFIESKPFSPLRKTTPVVVAGDLNDLWGSLGPKHLLPIGFSRAGRLTNTFPAALPLRPLDGLFYRGRLNSRHTAVGIARNAIAASDHRLIYSDFDFEE